MPDIFQNSTQRHGSVGLGRVSEVIRSAPRFARGLCARTSMEDCLMTQSPDLLVDAFGPKQEIRLRTVVRRYPTALLYDHTHLPETGTKRSDIS